MIFDVSPLFGDQPDTADFDIASVGLAPPFDFEALTIWFTGEDEQAHIRGISFDVFQDFVPCATVDGADEDIGLGFNEPAFENATDRGRRIVGNNDCHAMAEGGRLPDC